MSGDVVRLKQLEKDMAVEWNKIHTYFTNSRPDATQMWEQFNAFYDWLLERIREVEAVVEKLQEQLQQLDGMFCLSELATGEKCDRYKPNEICSIEEAKFFSFNPKALVHHFLYGVCYFEFSAPRRFYVFYGFMDFV